MEINSDCGSYAACVSAAKENQAAAVAAKQAEYAKSPAAFKRDDYAATEALLAEQSRWDSLKATAKRFAATAIEVLSGGRSIYEPAYEKVMP